MGKARLVSITQHENERGWLTQVDEFQVVPSCTAQYLQGLSGGGHGPDVEMNSQNEILLQALFIYFLPGAVVFFIIIFLILNPK